MIAETDRLILRQFSVDDATDFFELNTNPEVVKYTGDVAFESIKQAAEFLDNYTEYEQSGFGRWAVIRKDDNAFLGWCGLKRNEEGYVDIGFRFFQHFWGAGYATEAAQKSIEIGFNDYHLDEIIGRTAKQNSGSIRVLEKIGMEFFKTGDCHGIPDALYFRVRNHGHFS